jgi:hypothetical protein
VSENVLTRELKSINFQKNDAEKKQEDLPLVTLIINSFEKFY